MDRDQNRTQTTGLVTDGPEATGAPTADPAAGGAAAGGAATSAAGAGGPAADPAPAEAADTDAPADTDADATDTDAGTDAPAEAGTSADTGSSTDTATPADSDADTDANADTATAPSTDAGTPADRGIPTDTGTPADTGTASSADTGTPADTHADADTDTATAPSTDTDAAAPPASPTDGPADTGSATDAAPPTDPPTGAAAGPADTAGPTDTAGPVDPSPPAADAVDRLLAGVHHDPHTLLGAHPHPDGTVVRVLRPHADEVRVLRQDGADVALVRVHDAGLFSGVVPGPAADYRLSVRYGERVDEVDDPYRWLPTLGEMDLHLISEGRHERLWDVLGAHVRRYDTPSGPVTGTSFAVWAPAAQGVRVTGDFDGWTGWAHPMRVLGATGVWELFVPGIGPGTRYKFRVLGRDGRWREKADPLAFRTEIPPATASIVDAPGHTWGDERWLAARAARQPYAEPMSIYEVHLGSWKLGLGYQELARELVAYLDETAFTHVELLPVAEHPFGGSWGYQVTSYYAPTARFGSPDEFRWFVDHLHQNGYGVLVDWVPAHFPRDEFALARFDGTPLYEHADPRRGEQPDWGTLVFDFGRPEVRNFLVANALFWVEQFHIDGLRVDAVASMLYLDYSRPEGQWLPNIYGGRENLDAVAFLQEMNATLYKNHPGVITVAEESTAWPGVSRPTHLGGLGFGFKWNMGWMHDTLDYVGKDPVYRTYHHNQMTFSLMYAFSENFVLPLSHDEVVHGKGSLWTRMPGDAWNKAAGLRALLAYMWAHPGKQLLFQGGEFGQEREWSESRSLDWHLLEDPLHAGVKALVGDLNRAYRSLPALWTRDVTPDGFSWIDANDHAGNVLSFLRHGVDAEGHPVVMACVANFSGTPKPDYQVGLPFAGRWREVLNTDAESYGGSGVGNLGAVQAEPRMWHGRPACAVLQLPPSGVLWLTPDPDTDTGPVAVAPGAGVETEVDSEAETPPSGIPVVPPTEPEPITDPTPVVPPVGSPADAAGEPVWVPPDQSAADTAGVESSASDAAGSPAARPDSGAADSSATQ